VLRHRDETVPVARPLQACPRAEDHEEWPRKVNGTKRVRRRRNRRLSIRRSMVARWGAGGLEVGDGIARVYGYGRPA